MMSENEILYREETGRILSACMTVHNTLGNGFLEPVYQEALAIEFDALGIPYEREKQMKIIYRGLILKKEYFADFFCFEKIVVELKSVGRLAKAHKAQVINYLCASNQPVGLLINFGENSLKWERITRLETTDQNKTNDDDFEMSFD